MADRRAVLVTGASSGIGAATARLLAARGFRVYAAARRLDALQTLAGSTGGAVEALALDVTDAASIEAARRRIEADNGALFGLVNNAGVSVTGPLEETPISDWRRQYETNVFGLVAVTQAFLPAMRKARAGRIVNVGSVAGRLAAPFMGAYASSKHAVEGLSDSLRREAAPFGIKVSLVRPGFIHTPFGGPEQEGLATYAEAGRPYAAFVAAFKAWHAKGHPNGAPPEAVADVIFRALTAARPHTRYTAPMRYIGPIILRNTLPSAIVDRVFARVNGVASVKLQGT